LGFRRKTTPRWKVDVVDGCNPCALEHLSPCRGKCGNGQTEEKADNNSEIHGREINRNSLRSQEAKKQELKKPRIQEFKNSGSRELQELRKQKRLADGAELFTAHFGRLLEFSNS
jgi:hypothetical protein